VGWRALVPYLAYSYVTFVGITTRLRWRGREHPETLRKREQRFIFAFWHQRQVFFTWSHRGEPASVLVSRSADGELIAKTMKLSRIGTSRGSSTRAGAAGLLHMMETLKQGRDLGVTPDGPKGPARQVKSGVIFLAQKLGVPIIPISNALSRKLEFPRAWDHFQVPLPFGRAVVRCGPPITVAEGDDMAAKAEELRLALDAITQQAEDEVAHWKKS
jgi:lysophospholipid acyltransferase (LPLAT)-like uncharacterized protein